MNNRKLRKNAWTLYRTNFLKILPAMALLQCITSVPGAVIGQAASGYFAGIPVTQISAVLFAPVALCGAAAFSLDILYGGAPKAMLLFAHARDSRRISQIWLAALVYYGPTLLSGAMAGLIINMPSVLDLSSGAAIGRIVLLTALILVLMVLEMWFSLRFGLFHYIAVKNPEARAGEWLKTSWRGMKGHCGRLFRLMVSVFWPSVCVNLAIWLIIAQSGAASSAAKILSTPSILIFQCFYLGYPQLALAGFADDLLGGKRFGAPKDGAHKGAAAR